MLSSGLALWVLGVQQRVRTLGGSVDVLRVRELGYQSPTSDLQRLRDAASGRGVNSADCGVLCAWAEQAPLARGGPGMEAVRSLLLEALGLT